MAIPKWHEFMVPVLRLMSDGQTRRRPEIYALAADLVGLTPDERMSTLNSGQLTFENRVGWALSDLTKVGALSRPARGQYAINEVGRQVLADHPEGVAERDLLGMARDPAEPHAFYTTKALGGATADDIGSDQEPRDLDPTEQIENGVERLHASVAADLLARLHSQEPAFFEQAVLDLLMAMGYGGTEGKATRTQLSNDGGIDGVVDQDALGLSRIYVQAKRYALDAAIGRPEIQGFVGALHGNQANQGVFITTARFSGGAAAYAETVPTRVILIDGKRLASLMIRYGVGVQVKRTVQIVEVDEDFFE